MSTNHRVGASDVAKAAASLQAKWGESPWFTAVGIVQGPTVPAELIVYATKPASARKAVGRTFNEIPVRVVRMAKPRPAALPDLAAPPKEKRVIEFPCLWCLADFPFTELVECSYCPDCIRDRSKRRDAMQAAERVSVDRAGYEAPAETEAVS